MSDEELFKVIEKQINKEISPGIRDETRERLIANCKARPSFYHEGREFPCLYGVTAKWGLCEGKVGPAGATINLGPYGTEQMRYNLERDHKDWKIEPYSNDVVQRIGLPLAVSSAFLAPRGKRKEWRGQAYWRWDSTANPGRRSQKPSGSHRGAPCSELCCRDPAGPTAARRWRLRSCSGGT